MPVGPFLTNDNGLLEWLKGNIDWESGNVAAVLVRSAHAPDRSTEIDYEDIAANECDDSDYAPVPVPSRTISVEEGGRVRVDCEKITFTENGDITGRYLYFVYGDYASLSNGDLILGYIDLTGSDDASSVAGEFSFTPHANGLFEIDRSAAPD